MILLGYELDLRVLAEGGETAEQLKFLQESGCDKMQEYYFSKPVAANAVVALLQAQNMASSLIRLKHPSEVTTSSIAS